MENGGRPATRQDLSDLEARIIETMRDIQTELLKAFYSVTESNR
jgi:hypothetical protein